VTSWEPLDVYVFSAAYLKVCGNDFNLQTLQDQYSHLSNFSIQKSKFGIDETVMSHLQFEAYVREQGRPDFSWEKDMRPHIHQTVFATLKGVQDALEQRANTFEVYGFDLILDQRLRPWVIEVNLSPACAERADWITKMVDDMSLDLLAHLESRILEADSGRSLLPTLNKEAFYEEQKLDNRWIRLEESL
jgi:Tubulin-tyrosine ligase family